MKTDLSEKKICLKDMKVNLSENKQMLTAEEKAKELYPEETIIPMVDINGNPFETSVSVDNWINQKRDAYIRGYKEANAEWQEKVRWIPMQEGTYPEVRDKSYRILVKNEVGFMSTEVILSDYTHYNFENLRMFYTHWRKII